MIFPGLRVAIAAAGGLLLLLLAACSSGGGVADGDLAKADGAATDTKAAEGGSGTDAAAKSRGSGGSGGKLGDSLQTIQHEGKTRTFAVHVPPSYEESEPVPLVLHFHGWRPLPAGIASEIAYVWAKEADARGFIAAAPEGLPCPELNPKGKPYGCFKSVPFAAALLSDLGQKYNLDLRRIYLSGHSGGTYYVELTGLSNADKYAAVSGFSGGCITKGDNYVNSCSRYKKASDAARRKIPYFVIHGSNDQVVPVSWSANFIKLVLQANKHPYAVYPSKAGDVYNGGKYGHSVDTAVVPKVWSWLAQHTLP